MKYFYASIFFLLCIKISLAQYTEVINSNRPGFSSSPFSIGTKVYQIEGGFFYNKINQVNYWDPINEESVAYGSKAFGSDITFRTGQFFEQLEFILDMAIQNEDRNYTQPDIYNESGLGLSELTIGAKYLVYRPTYKDLSKEIRSWKARHRFDTRRLIPAVGVYAGFNTNLLNEMYKNPYGVSARFGLFLQNDFTNKFVFITNFIMDNAFTDKSENSYILTATYAFSERWSAFIDNQGVFRKNVPNDFQIGLGGVYLFNKNLQIDVSFRYILDERSDFSYLAGAGMSWRLDRHKDKIIKNKVNNGEESMSGEKDGFFARTGAAIGGLFSGKKSNGSSQRDVGSVKAKQRSLTPPVNKKAQKAKKKQNKQLIKQQKSKEKAEKKYSKSE